MYEWSMQVKKCWKCSHKSWTNNFEFSPGDSYQSGTNQSWWPKFSFSVCWFSSFLQNFHFGRWAKFGAFRAFSGECMKEWLKMWRVAISWPLSDLIRFWLQSVDFPFLYPPQRSLGGVYWIHPVRPSVCPSVCPSVRPSVRGSVSGW